MRSYLLAIYFLFFVLVQTGFANPLKDKFEEAMFKYKSGEFSQAVELFEQALVIKPDFAPTHFYLALAYKGANTEVAKVRQHLEKAVEFDPNYEMAYEYLSKLAYSVNDFNKTEEYGLKVLEINPDNSRAKLTLAWNYLLGKSQPVKAIGLFEQVIKSEQIPYYSYLGLGIAYYQDNQRAKVLEMITLLRSQQQDPLAKELESLLRTGDIKTLNLPGAQLLARDENEKSSLDRNLPPLNLPKIAGNEAIESMPVRLSSSMPQQVPSAPVLSSGALVQPKEFQSPQERLRTLQERSLSLPKEPTY